MSSNTQTDGGSIVIEQTAAERVMAHSRAKAHSQDRTPAVHPRVEVSGDISTLFDEGGDLIPADEVGGTVDSFPTEDADAARAFLAEHFPGRLNKIEEKVDELPGSIDDLLTRQVSLIEERAEEKGIALKGGSAEYTVTTAQESRPPLGPSEDGEDADEGGVAIEECPSCGSEDVTGHTVVLQTRAADESGTEVTKTSCGCTLRNYD